MPCLFVAPWLSVLSSTPVPPGALAALSLTMVMSLFAPGASPVAAAASAAVAVSPKASAAAVLKSMSFDLIEVSFRRGFGEARRTAGLSGRLLVQGLVRNVWALAGFRLRTANAFVPWAGSRLF